MLVFVTGTDENKKERRTSESTGDGTRQRSVETRSGETDEYRLGAYERVGDSNQRRVRQVLPGGESKMRRSLRRSG